VTAAPAGLRGYRQRTGCEHDDAKERERDPNAAHLIQGAILCAILSMRNLCVGLGNQTNRKVTAGFGRKNSKIPR
jgi:hypothetical protein